MSSKPKPVSRRRRVARQEKLEAITLAQAVLDRDLEDWCAQQLYRNSGLSLSDMARACKVTEGEMQAILVRDTNDGLPRKQVLTEAS